jgi:hypothetical protein
MHVNVLMYLLVTTRTIHRVITQKIVRVIKIVIKWRHGRGVQTSNVMIASRMGSNPDRVSLCFLEKETLHLLLSTGWFQERIQKCVYKQIASYTIDLK